jgi:uncharacterized membrane protein YdjX (TVP38/TMEM64 family)/1-acyl-sn-glycerol-3-phosphate acyltransferase
MTITKNTKLKIGIAVALVVVLGLLTLLLLSGENDELLRGLLKKELSDEQLQETLRGLGLRGYITVAVLAMLQVIFTFLPAEPVQVLSGAAFGFPVGLLCCWIGVFLGNTLIYLLQKTFGDKLRGFFIKKFHLDLGKIAGSGKSTLIVLLLYFLPAIPYGMIAFFSAGIGMRYRRYITLTMLGALPSVCIGVGLGHMAIASHWLVTVCVIVALVAVLVVITIKRDKLFSKINEFAGKTHSSKTTVGKSNRFLRALLYGAVRVYMFFCGIRIRVTNKCGSQPQAPSIVLCNHGSFIDFIYAEALLRKTRPHFVVARLYFYHELLGGLLKRLGSFPKSMFALDMESTKNCLRVFQNGEVLTMMPEARLSTAGRFEDIQPGTYSFLKKAGVPVYTLKICGDYFADPKWGKGFRRGSLVEAELDILFTAQQLQTMTQEEIRRGVEQRLDYDEFRWLAGHPEVRYRGKRLAEGLENILTVCPSCGGRHTITTKKMDVFCEKCGHLTRMDNRYGFTEDFRFENFGQWFDWQKSVLEEKILHDPDFSMSAKVEFRLPGRGWHLTRSAGSGICTLDRSGLTYTGTRDGEPCEAHFSLSRIYRLLFGAGENFEIYNGSEIWYFVPEERRSAVDWYMASMILYDEAHPRTDG